MSEDEQLREQRSDPEEEATTETRQGSGLALDSVSGRENQDEAENLDEGTDHVLPPLLENVWSQRIASAPATPAAM